MPTKTGYADLPLHGGKAPRWLFSRMVRLAKEIVLLMSEEFGTGEFLRRLSDPYWFQALGCLLGFDWHSSGLTTTTCGALKEALREVGPEIGLFAAGGKGDVSRRTPEEISFWAEREGIETSPLIYASRMSAKVDSAALQDGFQIYHHAFFFDRKGRWCVVQQGMKETAHLARRYHWLSEGLQSFVVEPHAGVVGARADFVLNLVAQEAEPARATIPELAQKPPDFLVKELKRLQHLRLPERHALLISDVNPNRLETVFLRTYEAQAKDFEELLGVPGLGAKGLRALALLSELVYGAPASFRDPARFSFAHGGKDGTPYPVDRGTYDRTIAVLERAIRRAHLGEREELGLLRRIPLLFRSP
ncbi:MAG: DUF763 domain-containing protein [Candidatus Bipolaricaulota bacterium]|nr:DUF763 domain-containing protein [Candidatus Bipolaricaulota bacterium]MDW8126766.1 DUF763 domain-containing protein [Candidatus Bipolaricaulota bacterium]